MGGRGIINKWESQPVPAFASFFWSMYIRYYKLSGAEAPEDQDQALPAALAAHVPTSVHNAAHLFALFIHIACFIIDVAMTYSC